MAALSRPLYEVNVYPVKSVMGDDKLKSIELIIGGSEMSNELPGRLVTLPILLSLIHI